MDKKLTEDEIREILRKPKMREVVKQIANETAILMNKKAMRKNKHKTNKLNYAKA